MSMILAVSPGLIWFGPLVLAVGVLGLLLSPLARTEIWRMTLTGAVITLIGLAPHLVGSAQASDGPAPAQKMLLSGMTSQIVY